MIKLSSRRYQKLADNYAVELGKFVMSALRRASSDFRQDAVKSDKWPDYNIRPEDASRVLSSFVAQLALAGAPPEPPSVGKISRVGTPAARRASSVERGALLRAGANPRILASRLGINGEEQLIGIKLNLSPGEQQLLNLWASEGAQYIGNAGRQMMRELPLIVKKNTESGGRWETMAKEIQKKLDINRKRARFIAKDQTSNLNGRITKHLHEKAGVKEYVWRSTGSAHVRPEHQIANGNVFSWAGPGAPGAGYGRSAHPSQGIGCECTAEPIVPDDWR